MNLWEEDHFRCEVLFRQEDLLVPHRGHLLVPHREDLSVPHREHLSVPHKGDLPAIILDTSPLRQTKCQWLVEGKVLLLEFQGKRIPYIFEKLWDKIAEQYDNIISATIYKWDVLDQHPGTRTVFSRSNV